MTSSLCVIDSMNAKSKRPELRALTGLRFFAAFYVVIVHTFLFSNREGLERFIQWLPSQLTNFLDRGYVSVNLFFVLSGFILTYGYSLPSGAISVSRSTFWMARVARIWPVYLLGFLCAAPVVLRAKYIDNPGSLTNFGFLGSALANLALVQNWIPVIGSWNPPAWSLSTEACFYLLFPFLLPRMAGLRTKTLWLLLVTLYGLSLLPPTLLSMRWSYTDHLYDLAKNPVGVTWHQAILYNPWLRLPEFLIGAATGILFLRHRQEGASRRGGAFLSYFATIGILVALACLSKVPWPVLMAGGLTPLFCLLIYALAKEESVLQRFLSAPLIVLLGQASYAIYILHWPIMQYIELLLLRLHVQVNPEWAVLLHGGLTTICVVPLSILVFWYIEEPARKRIRAWMPKVARTATSLPPLARTAIIEQ